MYIEVLKSKIHKAVVTHTELNYEGSITVDEKLMEAADLIEGEKVQVVNNNNGARFETYVITGEKHSGVICLNGAAARKAQIGDILIIISYGKIKKKKSKTFKPIIVFPSANNQLIK